MRCFIGINLDDYKKEFKKITLPTNLKKLNLVNNHHLTLLFFENLTPEIIDRIKNQLDSIQFKKFEIIGDKVLVFPDILRPEFLSLGFKDDSKLIELHRKLCEITNFLINYRYTPHVTLMRKEKINRSFKDSKKDFAKIQPIKIKIKEIGLYESNPEKGMNTYTLLKSIKLK